MSELGHRLLVGRNAPMMPADGLRLVGDAAGHYEGGETDLPELGLNHRGSRCSALYFRNSHPDGQPDFRMVHAGRPPVRGEKWIVSQFIRSIPLRP